MLTGYLPGQEQVNQMNQNVKCMSCGSVIRLEPGQEKGDITYCQVCDTEHLILNTSPLRVRRLKLMNHCSHEKYRGNGQRDRRTSKWDFPDL